jgi:hypothetical protein
MGMDDRMSFEAIYIPHGEAEAYRLAGWTVVPLNNHHGFYSMLAWRRL